MPPDWKKELVERTELTEEEAEEKIQEKVEEFDGLVTASSAPILVAREHGIELKKELKQNRSQELDIENIVAGMRSFKLVGHVEEVQDEYNPPGKDYRVTSIVLSDDTGKTEVGFWNEDSDQAQKLRPGLKLEITDAYTKDEPSDYNMNKYGVPGVNLSDTSTVTVYNEHGEEKVLIE